MKDRLQALKEHGVTSLNVGFLGTTTEERVKNCDALSDLIAGVFLNSRLRGDVGEGK